MTFQGKIIFNLKWCINNLNVNSIQFPEWFSNFSAKNNTRQSNVRDGEHGFDSVFLDCRYWFAWKFVVCESFDAWPKNMLWVTILYEHIPQDLGRKVRESFRKLYGIDIKVIYTSFKVKNYFSLKCHTPLPLLAKVVYKFQCLHDVDKVYIGKTRRHLATRVKEHGHSTSSSAIRDHLSSCPTCQSEYSSSSFRVIDTARNDFEVTIKEALHIKNSKPALNRQLFNSGSSFVLNIF